MKELKSKRIVIGVCAYLRPTLLKQCLESLVKINIPEDVSVHLLLVDNDPDRSAKPVINSLEGSFAYPVHYFCEERRGISFARNCCFQESNKLQADHLIFIDSDETVSVSWLCELYSFFSVLNQVAVVSGHVEYVYPDSASWVFKFLLTEPEKNLEHAPYLTNCVGTGNVMLPMSIVNKHHLRFNEKRALEAGGDHEFFYKVISAGYKVYQLSDAKVKEHVSDRRATILFELYAYFAKGAARSYLIKKEGKKFNYIFVRVAFHCISSFIIAIFYLVCFNPKKCFRRICRIAKQLGKLYGYFGGRCFKYKQSFVNSDMV